MSIYVYSIYLWPLISTLSEMEVLSESSLCVPDLPVLEYFSIPTQTCFFLHVPALASATVYVIKNYIVYLCNSSSSTQFISVFKLHRLYLHYTQSVGAIPF